MMALRASGIGGMGVEGLVLWLPRVAKCRGWQDEYYQ